MSEDREHAADCDDREIAGRDRAFVDTESRPWEVHDEMHDGTVPNEVALASASTGF